MTRTSPAAFLSAQRKPVGIAGWALQRVTAVLMLLFLGVHIGLLHYYLFGQHITFAEVAQRFRHPAYVALDLGLLVTAVFHGCNGLRAVLLDLPLSPRAQRAAFWALVAVGIIVVAYGANALLAFL